MCFNDKHKKYFLSSSKVCFSNLFFKSIKNTIWEIFKNMKTEALVKICRILFNSL